MGLRTYLTALNEPLICPNYRHGCSLDPNTRTIGETAYQIPLVWLGMFRVSDLIEERVSFDPEEAPETIKSPLTSMERAISNLHDSAKLVNSRFPDCPRLGSYFEIMAEEITLFDFKYVTIDATELLPELNFGNPKGNEWESALIGFDSPSKPEDTGVPERASLLDRLLFRKAAKPGDPWLAAINVFVEFSPADSLPDPSYQRLGLPATEKEQCAHARLLPGGPNHPSVWKVS